MLYSLLDLLRKIRSKYRNLEFPTLELACLPQPEEYGRLVGRYGLLICPTSTFNLL